VLALILGSRTVSAVHADATNTFTNSPNSGSNIVGYHIIEPSSDSNNIGFSLDLDSTSTPRWSFGMDKATTTMDFFIYSHLAGNRQFWLRGDTGQITIAPDATQPVVGSRQLDVVGGTSSAPIGAIRAKVFGALNGLSLTQGQNNSRTQINFNNQWQLGTDWGSSVLPGATCDLWLRNVINSHQVMEVTNADLVKFNYGLAHSGPELLRQNPGGHAEARGHRLPQRWHGAVEPPHRTQEPGAD